MSSVCNNAPVEIYGSSETGGIAWRQTESLWQPLPGVQLALNTEGALRIDSPWLALGQTEQTADAAELFADGRFALRGRLDRIIKLEEKRISLPFWSSNCACMNGSAMCV